MKFRTLGLIALLAIGVLALTGCNKNNTPVENPQENVEVTTTVQNPEEVTEVANPEEITEVANPEEVTEVANPEKTAEVANPAETYCEENGGTLMPRADGDGNAYTLCAFDNGIACEVNDFFNGDCQP